MANESNEEIVKTIASTPDADSVKKAVRRGLSVTEILDNERNNWLERHRGVVVKKKGSMGHPHAYKTFERYFEKMSQYLFFIPVMGRVLVAEKNHKDVMAVETAVIKAIDGAIAKFDELIGQYKAAMSAHDIPVGEYNKSYAIEVSFASPLDKKYFQVLEKADLCLLLNYNLWVENALNPDYQKNELHRTENEWEVKRLIKNVNYQTIVNYRRLLNSVNRDQRTARPEANSVSAVDASVQTKVAKAEVVKEKPIKKTKSAPVADTSSVAAMV